MLPYVKTGWDSVTLQYGSEEDLYKVYFYVYGKEQIIEVWVNTLTGVQKVYYGYELQSRNGDFIGMCQINVFDSNDQMYYYRSGYWSPYSSYSPTFAKMIPSSAYDL